MEPKEQRAEDQFAIRKPSAGTTLSDFQEVSQGKAFSIASHGRYSITLGPQVEKRLRRLSSTVNDPKSIMREDYLSRPTWLYDIGKYPMSLCPQVGEDGAPRRTSTGAPIFATEDRSQRRPSWLTDNEKCPHIIHYGAHRKSSTGAPIFALEEQNLHRASFLTSAGKLPTTTGSHIVEYGESRRTSTGALVFATKDGIMHRPSWLTNTDKYPITISPHLAEERAHRKSSAGSSMLAPEDGKQKRPFWVSDHPKSQSFVYPFIVEVRPNRLHSLEEHPSLQTPLVIKEEDSLAGLQYRPPIGAPIAVSKDNRDKLSLMIRNSNVLTTTSALAADEVAPKRTSSGTLISSWKEREVHRASAMTNLRLLTLKRELLQGQAVPLPGVENKTPPVQFKPHKASSTKNQPVTVSSTTDAPGPGLSESAAEFPLEGPTVGLESTRAKSRGHKVKLHQPASIFKSGPNTFSGQFLQGRSMTNWAAWKWSENSEIRQGKSTLPFRLSKNVRFNLRRGKVRKLGAARCKSVTEDTQPSQDTANIKKRQSCPFMDNYAEFKARMSGKDNQRKHRKASTSITLNTQTLEAQGFKLLHILLTKQPHSTQREEENLAGNITGRACSSKEDVKLLRFSSKITKRPVLDLSPQRTEDQATRHMTVTQAIKELQGYNADSSTSTVDKTSDLQKAKGKTTGPQVARAKSPLSDKVTAVEIQAPGPESTADKATDRPQSANARAIDMQAAGTRSTAEVTTVDEATVSTRTTNQTVGPPKVVDQAPGDPHARFNSSQEAKHTRPLMATKNVWLTIDLQDQTTGVQDARSNWNTTEAKPLTDDTTTKLVYQTLYLGRVALLPATVNPEEFMQQSDATSRNTAMCELGVTGVNLSRAHLQPEKLQQLTKSVHSEGPCPTPHPSSYTLVVTSGGEHEDSKDLLRECPRSHMLLKEFEHQKLLKLKDSLKGKMRESPRKLSIQGKRNRIRQQLQQNRKQLQKEPLFVKGYNTSFLEHSVISNEPHGKKSDEPPKEVSEEYEMDKKRKDSTLSCKKPSTDFKEQHSKHYKRLELDITNKLSKPPRTFQLIDITATDIQEFQNKKTRRDRAKIRSMSSEFIQQRNILQKKVNELDTMNLRNDQLRHKKRKPLGVVKTDPYKDFHVITDLEKCKTIKPIFLCKSWIENPK